MCINIKQESLYTPKVTFSKHKAFIWWDFPFSFFFMAASNFSYLLLPYSSSWTSLWILLKKKMERDCLVMIFVCLIFTFFFQNNFSTFVNKRLRRFFFSFFLSLFFSLQKIPPIGFIWNLILKREITLHDIKLKCIFKNIILFHFFSKYRTILTFLY